MTFSAFRLVGLGGTFVARNGKVSQSIMPRDFPQIPLKSKPEIQNWFRFYDIQTPITAVGTLVNKNVYFQKTLSYKYVCYLYVNCMQMKHEKVLYTFYSQNDHY